VPDGPLHVSISGGIAVGKTTLTLRLSEKLTHCVSLLEYPENNPYLADFYADMKRWAFHSRIAMLSMFSMRYRTLQNETPDVQIVLMDRCIHELGVFAALQHAAGNLSDRDFEIYRGLHESFMTLVPPLNVVIYLWCSTDAALARAKKRARHFEAGLTAEYVHRVSDYYRTWLASLPNATRVWEYDTCGDVDVDGIAQQLTALAVNSEPRD